MKNTEILQTDVMDELAWDPQVDSSDIAVTVQDNIVTLAGHTASYMEKLAAEKAARRVKGVKAVVNDIDVRIGKAHRDSDSILATNALAMLRWSANIPADMITVVVQDGWIKLEGEVKWFFQKRAAEKAVRNMYGVKGVMNHLKVTPAVAPSDVKDKIRAAFQRNAYIDSKDITVEAEGGRIILRGTVRSWAERSSAERAAWSAPGVTEVVNNLDVDALMLV
jgi:osmotically-inducible protein OsmY